MSDEARIASLETGQQFIREALDRIERRQENFATDVHEARESMHAAALTMERTASRLVDGDKRMTSAETTDKDHETRLASLETSRTKHGAYLTAAGVVGAGVLWLVEHAAKLLFR